MFTGLIETIGVIKNIQPYGDVERIEISAPQVARELKLGDSVAVSGACLTVVWNDADAFRVEMMQETRGRTSLANKGPGAKVNLERAMRLDGRLDGHLVAGHVDGTAVVEDIVIYGQTRKYMFSAAPELLVGIVPKGSVAIDGVSLTVIDADDKQFSVGIIPTTLADTTLADLKTGGVVNIETDMIGKYIHRMMTFGAQAADPADEAPNTLTWEKLAEYGWH